MASSGPHLTSPSHSVFFLSWTDSTSSTTASISSIGMHEAFAQQSVQAMQINASLAVALTQDNDGVELTVSQQIVL
ncbi:hypothetical protein ACA910_010069 [Epithemia clementina (nom. ined.)]